MTLVRMMAHRAGWIDEMIPQAVERWTRRKTGLVRAPNHAVHTVMDQALHLGYGLAWGALYGGLRGLRQRSGSAAVLELTTTQWALGSWFLLPMMRITRPPWQKRAATVAVDLAAHLAYASATVFLTEELSRQLARNPRTPPTEPSGQVG